MGEGYKIRDQFKPHHLTLTLLDLQETLLIFNILVGVNAQTPVVAD